MIRHLLATITLCAALGAPAQTPSDTLKVINNATSVTIDRQNNRTIINVTSDDNGKESVFTYTVEVNGTIDSIQSAPSDESWGLSLPFLKEKKPKRTTTLWGERTYIGFAFPVNAPTGLDQSVDCGIGQLIGFRYSPWQRGPQFSIGAGFHFEQYCLHSNSIFDKTGDRLIITPLADPYTRPSSRLLNFGVSLPLCITQPVYKDFAVSVGATLRLNTFTKASSEWHDGDITYKRTFKGLQQRMLNYDINLALGLRDELALYVRYQPVSLFRSANGPRFETLSFGFIFGI